MNAIDTTTDMPGTSVPNYAMDAAAEPLRPLHRYYAQMEERPSFNEFAFRVSDWFHTWMDDAYASDEPLWDENLLRDLHIEAASGSAHRMKQWLHPDGDGNFYDSKGRLIAAAHEPLPSS